MLNYTGNALGKFDVIVEDEGHILDSQLENFIALKINKKRFENLFDISLPSFDKVLLWANWSKDNLSYLKESLEPYENLSPDLMNMQEIRDKSTMEEYIETLARIGILGREDSSWVVEEGESQVVFQPVWMTEDSEEILFRHAKRHIIMSGTIPSSKYLGKKIGLSEDQFEFLRLPYLFPPENRQIVFKPRVDLTYKNRTKNLPTLVREVDEDLGDLVHWGIKGLIHTVNYQIAEYLYFESSFREYMITHTTRDRVSKMMEFKESKGPRVLVSPSMDKAVDFPGDECELILVCKLPFPNLGSKVMKQRAKEDRGYYTHETLMGLIQMAGRGNRQESDICTTIVYDSLGPKFIRQDARRMIPEGIKEAIRYE